MPKTESMPASESVIKVTYSDEIASKPSWYQLVRHATAILQTEIIRDGGIAPAVLADWSVTKSNGSGQPTFRLRLFDFPDDPKPVVADFTEEFLIKEHDKLRKVLNDLWREFLRHRSRRLAREINADIRGSMSGAGRDN